MYFTVPTQHTAAAVHANKELLEIGVNMNNAAHNTEKAPHRSP